MSKALPALMRAVGLRERGSADVLTLKEVPVPQPTAGELLIRVEAVGVNRADIILRNGDVPLPISQLPEICGLEVAGTVVRSASVGQDTALRAIEVGDEVCALVPAAGGYSEFCCVPASLAFPVPDGLSLVEAAALPEAIMTTWNALFDEPIVHPGETLLIHGGTSGVGHIAIMLAKQFGIRVIATAGSAAKCEAMRSWGVALAIDYRQEDFVDAVLAHTEGAGVDVILDIVAGSYIQRNVAALATGGRCVHIGMMESPSGLLDVATLMSKRAQMIGASLWFRTLEEKSILAATVRQRIWPLIDAGVLKPVIDCILPLEQARHAHVRMESGQHIGKIILSPSRTAG